MFYKKWWAAAVAVALVVVVTGANYGCVSTSAPRVEPGDGGEWGVYSVKLYYDSPDDNGVAIYEWEYDGAGNITREENYGADGQLTLDSYGVAIYGWEYDSAGNRIRGENYGVDGQLVAANGVAIIEWEYDSAGNVVETRLYDARGRLIE